MTKKIKDTTIVASINDELNILLSDYSRITENLVKSAGAGLNLSSILHQVEKQTNNIRSYLKRTSNDSKLIDMVESLFELIRGYTSLIKNSNTKIQPINPLIDYTIDICKFRFDNHHISVISQYKGKEINCKCSKHYIINCLMNLFDNSIWWMDYANIKDKKIFIDIQNEHEDTTSLIIADNGPGFGTLSADELTTPFFSMKPEGSGMGIGLHITQEMMRSIGGNICFPDPSSILIPEEFTKGAVIELQFKNKD